MWSECCGTHRRYHQCGKFWLRPIAYSLRWLWLSSLLSRRLCTLPLYSALTSPPYMPKPPLSSPPFSHSSSSSISISIVDRRAKVEHGQRQSSDGCWPEMGRRFLRSIYRSIFPRHPRSAWLLSCSSRTGIDFEFQFEIDL